MKLLIIGASGVLGSRLYNDTVIKKWAVMGTYCSHAHEELFYLNLKDGKSVEETFSFFHPDVVVLAGGITDVDLCEERPGLAEDVNIKGTLTVAKKAKECGAKLVFLSTDYIFNGENGPYWEQDAPHPINIYGRTKLEAENIIKGLLKDYLIVRTAQLYGMDSSIEFHNHTQHLGATRLYYEVPNHKNYPCSPESSPLVSYYICQRAHVWFVCTRIYHLTLSMLVQRYFQETDQPFHTPYYRIRIIALK